MSAENLSGDPAVSRAGADGRAGPAERRPASVGVRPSAGGDSSGDLPEPAARRPATDRPSANLPTGQDGLARSVARAGESWVPLGARPARNAIIGAGLIGYAWWLGGAPAFGTKALIGVLVPGVVLGAIAYGRPPERIPPPQRVDVTGFSYWIICIALLFEWEASAFRVNAPPWHPALTTLIDPLIAPHPVKCAAIVIWLLSGWALVKR